MITTLDRIIAPPKPEEEEKREPIDVDDDDDRKDPRRKPKSTLPDRAELAELVTVLTALRRLIGRQNVAKAILRGVFG
jgi:hypothetical protein